MELLKNVINSIVSFKSKDKKIIDFTTVESIISISKDNFYDNVNGVPLYYFLQRQATQYKKNDSLDLAIACLRKSNEISDTYEHPPLLEKDYLRLPKYIKLTGNLDLAKFEEKQIYIKHPEFTNKCISNKKRINDIIEKASNFNEDFIYVSSFKSCNICGKYDGQIYSISGKSKTYKKLPSELLSGGNCKEHIIGYSIHFNIN